MSQFDPPFVVKICGITRQQDLDVSIVAGANAVGFNFYARSPRYLTPEDAGQLKTSAECLRVGVFANATEDQLRKTIATARLDAVQLHGSISFVPDHVKVWRSIPADVAPPVEDPRIEAYLVDTPTPEYGGSGRTFDWESVRQFPFRMILAGGLDPENVARAIETMQPWGVDACSRLELNPGRKDEKRVRAFIQNALRAKEVFSAQAAWRGLQEKTDSTDLAAPCDSVVRGLEE